MQPTSWSQLSTAWGAKRRSRPATTAENVEITVRRILEHVIRVPDGEFLMGSPIGETGRLDVEGPQRIVKIEAFEVGTFAVTMADFDLFVAASGYPVADMCQLRKSTGWELVAGSFRTPGFEQTGAHPAVCVSWDDAQAFVRWLSAETGSSFRLLSESEWEYCARAGTITRYPWGDTIVPGQANCKLAVLSEQQVAVGIQRQCTVPVMSYAPNPWGIYQMHGNVWEWAEDYYVPDYNGAPTDGSARLLAGRELRVLRGGSWNNGPNGVRSARRHAARPGFRRTDVGFRIARTL
jgi:formylglycine-generating enzyme required for sulfatase activity